MNSKCFNPTGHNFIPIEWEDTEMEVIDSVKVGNLSTKKITSSKVIELYCSYCEAFKKIDRK